MDRVPIFLIVFLMGSSVFPLGGDNKDFSQRYLYEETAKNSILVDIKEELLPDRVYIVFSEELKEWVYVKTDAAGKCSNPPEVLGVGTVLEGSMIGSSRVSTHYRLTSQGTWAPTKDPLNIQVMSLGETPMVRVTEFFPTETFQVKIRSAKK